MVKHVKSIAGLIVVLAAAGTAILNWAPWVRAGDVDVMKESHHKLYNRLLVDASETADRAIQNEINNLNYTLINLFPALADAKKRNDREAMRYFEQQKIDIEQKIEELKKKKGTMFK